MTSPQGLLGLPLRITGLLTQQLDTKRERVEGSSSLKAQFGRLKTSVLISVGQSKSQGPVQIRKEGKHNLLVAGAAYTQGKD